MSQQTAQSRSCSDKRGGSHAPSGENGRSWSSREPRTPATSASPASFRPGRPGKRRKDMGAAATRRCTIALHGPAAEPGQVIWEMSAETHSYDDASPKRVGRAVPDGNGEHKSPACATRPRTRSAGERPASSVPAGPRVGRGRTDDSRRDVSYQAGGRRQCHPFVFACSARCGSTLRR